MPANQVVVEDDARMDTVLEQLAARNKIAVFSDLVFIVFCWWVRALEGSSAKNLVFFFCW